MWISADWKDYEVIDCSGGERLERWGDLVLVRPDPQAIWDTPKKNNLWHSPDAKYERSHAGGGKWRVYGKMPENWKISYKELTFNIKLMNFKHTGVFPEQAANWDYIIRKIKGAGRPIKALNLFAYTGGATLAASSAGAEVCHVDAAKGMVSWARGNAEASGLGDRPIRWIVDDCVKFAEREIRRGRKYDAIIMDPPSYGRGPSGEVWKLEENLYPFVKTCGALLSDDPLFVIINSYSTGLSPESVNYIAESVFTKKFGGGAKSAELGLPVRQSGLALPCGAACRWEK
jgi:23S rRNA (cytosine1962-C5)-methyltransferase